MDFAAIGPINSTKSSRLLNVVEGIYPGGGVCHPGDKMDSACVKGRTTIKKRRRRQSKYLHVVFVIDNQYNEEYIL